MDARFFNRTRKRSVEDLKSKGRIERERQWGESVKRVLNLAKHLGEVKWSESHSVVSDSLGPHGLYSPWHSAGQNTRVDRFPFSRGSSQPRHWTQVSHTAGRFFTNWATWEAHLWEEPAFEGVCSSLYSLLFTGGKDQISSLWTQQRHFSLHSGRGAVSFETGDYVWGW